MATTEVPKAYHFASRRKSSAPSGGKSGGGKIGVKALSGIAGVPSSREIGGMADGVEGPPQLEKQGALRATAAGPAYTPGSLMDIITGNKTGESNPNFDAAKPIGGDNVPFKETTGIGGWFSRLAGNKANQLNAAAQQEQAADWKSEEAELRKARIEDERFARAENAATKRFEMARKAQVEDRDLTMEQQRIRDAAKWVDEDAEREQAAIDRIKARELQAAELEAQKSFRAQQLALEQQKLDAMRQPKPVSPELRDIGGIGYMMKGDEIFRVDGNNLVPVRALPQYKGGATGGAMPAGGGKSAGSVSMLTPNATTAAPSAVLDVQQDTYTPMNPLSGYSQGWSLAQNAAPSETTGYTKRVPFGKDVVITQKIPQQNDPRVGGFFPESPDITAEELTSLMNPPKTQMSDADVQDMLLQNFSKGELPQTVEGYRRTNQIPTKARYSMFGDSNNSWRISP